MTNPFLSRQFVLFVVTGGIAATVNFLSRIIYNQWTDFSTAIVLAYLTGMITAFILAKLFVFKETQQSVHKSAIFFTLVNVAAVAQTWLISMGLAFYVFPGIGLQHFSKEIAHAAGVAFPVFSSYLGHKHFSFR